MRVLVTGSRDWTDRTAVAETLALTCRPPRLPGERFVLVSGACPTGADALAEQVAEDGGWAIERHPADWATHGRRAGFVRNREMVALGADVCLAFLNPCRKSGCGHMNGRAEQHDSHGAAMTAALAEGKGIPVVYVRG